MTIPEPDLGTYAGQPVTEGDSGSLVYDCDPQSRDGCLIRVPVSFLGLPHMREPDLPPGPEPEPEAEP